MGQLLTTGGNGTLPLNNATNKLYNDTMLVGSSKLDQLPSTTTTSTTTTTTTTTSTTTTTTTPPPPPPPAFAGTNSDLIDTAIYSSDLTGQPPSPTNNNNNGTSFSFSNSTFPNINNNGTGMELPDSDGDSEYSINLFGNVLYPFRWLTLPVLSSWLGPISSTCMIVGCVLPYVPQYTTIHKTRSCSGFSTFVCLTLLLSNILRIAFWFGHHFELPLLVQSIIMVFTQIALLELCVRVKNQSAVPPPRRTLWSFNPRHFWRWTNLASYLEFILLFSALLGVLVYFFIDCELFIETLGYCALVIESVLGLPQVIKNFRKKSVEGMSLGMVLMWLAGDTFKTGYFIANAVPYQFWVCGFTQITIDIIILIEVCLYRNNAHHKMGSSLNESPKEMVAL